MKKEKGKLTALWEKAKSIIDEQISELQNEKTINDGQEEKGLLGSG
jgi:hypothetical protein